MQNKGRINFIFICLLLTAVFIIGRLYVLQVVDYEAYAREADSQYSSRPQNIFERGSIMFKTKDGDEISAAGLKSGYTAYIKPELISDEEGVYEKISEIVSVDHDAFIRSANKKEDPYEEIAWRLTVEERDSLKELGIKGLNFTGTQWRYYPGGSLASHVLGFVGFNKDVLEGRYGIERGYEETLNRGERDIYRNFFADVFSNAGEALASVNSSEAKDGDVVLTIEPNVQKYIENEISNLASKWSAEGGGIVVVEPKTGAIRALAVWPTYDLNKYSEVSDIGVFPNPIIEKVFEMGSIMKTVTLAAGIDSGVITPSTRYDDKGFVTKNGEVLSNFDKVGRGWVDMQVVMNKSLNTGSVFMVEKMGNITFSDYIRKFGFTEKTGVDLPNEVIGLTDNLLSDRDVEFATASFGQGIAVSPIAMIRAVGAIANGGYLMKPYVVERVSRRYGIDDVREPIEQGRVISKESSEMVTRMLVKVVDEAYQVSNPRLPHYSVAGKTGTGQIARPEGGYYEDKRLHSFVGYFPAYDPEFLVFIYLENPRGISYASQTLIDPFFDVAELLVNEYDIAPDR